MSKLKVVKLDRRMNGRRFFTHRVDIFGLQPGVSETLHRVREWLWATHGPGAELAVLERMAIRKPNELLWAWDTEHYNVRLYLAGAALTQFLMMKSKFEQET